MDEQKMAEHIRILGILFIIAAVILILGGIVVAFIFLGSGLLTRDSRAMAILTIVGIVISSLLFVLGILNLISGWGLLNRKKWSRLLTIILAIIKLLNFPIGMALGVYALWVLFQPESEKLLTQ